MAVVVAKKRVFVQFLDCVGSDDICMFIRSKPSLLPTFVLWLFVLLVLTFAGKMHRGLSGIWSLSEADLRVSTRLRRNNVTLDESVVISEKMASFRKKRGGYASNLTRRKDVVLCLLDKGANADRVGKKIAEVIAALKDLFDSNAKYVELLEGAGLTLDVTRAQVYYAEN